MAQRSKTFSCFSLSLCDFVLNKEIFLRVLRVLRGYIIFWLWLCHAVINLHSLRTLHLCGELSCFMSVYIRVNPWLKIL